MSNICIDCAYHRCEVIYDGYGLVTTSTKEDRCYAHKEYSRFNYVTGRADYDNIHKCIDFNEDGRCPDFERKEPPPSPPENVTKTGHSLW